MPETPRPNPAAPIEAVTGVQLARGIGVQPAKGFWAEAWSQVVRRPAALLALCWLAVVAFFAVFAPVLASGHPIAAVPATFTGSWVSADFWRTAEFPLWRFLAALDLVLIVWVFVGVPYIMIGRADRRAHRLGYALAGLIVAIAILSLSTVVKGRLDSMATDAGRESIRLLAEGKTPPPITSDWRMVSRWPQAGLIVGVPVGALVAAVAALAPWGRRKPRIIVCAVAAVASVWAVSARWSPPLARFDYAQREMQGSIKATYTVIPWSPNQRFSELSRKPPGSEFSRVMNIAAPTPVAGRTFMMGTDAFGADVLAQVLHACRLSISIGVVSTGIALLIGVTMGALMGYFGGWVDLLLYRIVEVFMAVPVLFLLIVAVAVLPDEFKTTYVIMGIIGCFTWTGMARFTRAEFLKLRNQDFVQAAQASGLPLRSILFKHILPNGVAPVLVDTSFAVAAAISIEAVLSYLGLGPVDSPSWGKLLSMAVSQEGEFKWWLAVFPGAAIFLTVLSYNFLGEALRDAIDPKLKKARV
ncbi:MAG: ABC transporter permease [Phycisphaeraceae bacterium]|nr:ABC transporter permease [Phycisphaeraceae bacterium]MBX3406084.1 ABC transporter permease [Phycisphaeraceae bacterium]